MKNQVERYFTPADFLNQLEGERQWFILLDGLRRQRWQCAWPEESPEGHAVIMMLRDRAYWLRN